MLENLPVLLKFDFDNEILTLRLDNLGLQNFNNDSQGIRKVILFGCSNKVSLINDLQELTGNVFEYEIYADDNNEILEFWGDYSRFYSKINFKSIEEIFSEYTNEDLVLKGKILGSLYTDLYEKHTENYANELKVRERLKTRIIDEIYRFERKAEFFEDTSKAYQQSVKVLRKLLNTLEKSE